VSVGGCAPAIGKVAEARSGGAFANSVLSLVIGVVGVVHTMKACRKWPSFASRSGTNLHVVRTPATCLAAAAVQIRDRVEVRLTYPTAQILVWSGECERQFGFTVEVCQAPRLCQEGSRADSTLSSIDIVHLKRSQLHATSEFLRTGTEPYAFPILSMLSYSRRDLSSTGIRLQYFIGG
jgi:hypothetical protein